VDVALGDLVLHLSSSLSYVPFSAPARRLSPARPLDRSSLLLRELGLLRPRAPRASWARAPSSLLCGRAASAAAAAAFLAGRSAVPWCSSSRRPHAPAQRQERHDPRAVRALLTRIGARGGRIWG
jgi:hypothetical protein